MYKQTWETNNTTQIKGVEIPIRLPDMPPEEEMINYGLPVTDQKWRRVIIPDEFRTRARAMRQPWQKVKEFVDEMWHHRINGQWWLIKGNPIYITGSAFMYFNFWPYQMNKYPGFTIPCVEWFQVALHVERDPDVLGCDELKCRRAYSTEMAICWGWDGVTKYRDKKFGIQSKTDNDAGLAFNRVTFSNKYMPWFFKPKHKGMDRPTSALEFMYPPQVHGAKSNQDVDIERAPELNSKIWFEPTVVAAFDGERLFRYVLDEKGKIKRSKMDVFRQWEVVKECTTLNVGKNIVGKSWLPSTVEEIDSGDALEVISKMWRLSDPNAKDEVGRTGSGLIRMFRGYWVAAEVDEYGYPKIEEAARIRNAHIRKLEQEGELDALSDYKRKYPATIADALAPPAHETVLSGIFIDRAMTWIEETKAKDPGHHLLPVRGNLSWKDGVFGGEVVWTPDPSGHWMISRHPHNPNAKIRLKDGSMAPGNTDIAAMGVDPVDDTKPKSGGSDGAATVAFMQDYVVDQDMTFDADDILQSFGMWSDACACDYLHRPDIPEQFYEDMLMTAVYYGVQMLVEKNKPGLVNWGYEKGFGAYFAQKPVVADTRWQNKTHQSRSRDVGAPATTETIQNYYGLLKSHLGRRYRNYTHDRLLTDMSMLTAKNRTERDLAVAWGWCLTLMAGIRVQNKKQRGQERAEQSVRQALPIEVYD